MAKRYDDEFKARGVRLVTDHVEEYDARTACIAGVAKRLGVSYESLRRWVNRTEVDTGQRDGVPTDAVWELRGLRRKNRELEETIGILEAATSFVAREGRARWGGVS
ncbi:transposase [Mycobacterium sp.]|uniref:transposase n=1 Tax=Mycobacterium sp. TaxID=1785 RepID=UPI003A83F55E